MASKFLESSTLGDEWQQLSLTEPPFVFNPRKDHIDGFWGKIDKFKFPNGYFFFCCKVTIDITTFNADIERVLLTSCTYQNEAQEETKTSTLDALLVTHSRLPSDYMSHFVPDSDMCKCVSARTYNSSSSEDDE